MERLKNEISQTHRKESDPNIPPNIPPLDSYFSKSFEKYSKKGKDKKTNYFKVNDFSDDIKEHFSTHYQLFASTPDNTLFKLYTLLSLFLPAEIKGDFLGFVKTHYYDSKNIIDYHGLKLTGKESEHIIHDTFFHHMRLFSKQIKSYDIFKYTLNQMIPTDTLLPLKNNAITRMVTKNQLEALSADEEKKLCEFIDKQNLSLQLVKPLLSFYQLIGHLCNQVEVKLLLAYAEKNGCTSLHEAFGKIKGDRSILTFSKLLETVYGDVYQDNPIYPEFTMGKKRFISEYIPYVNNTRNMVMHMKLDELLRTNISDPTAFGKLHQGIFELIKLYKILNLHSIPLGTDCINQYLNAYDQLVSQLKLKYDYRVVKKQDDLKNKETLKLTVDLKKALNNYFKLLPFIESSESLKKAIKTEVAVPDVLANFIMRFTPLNTSNHKARPQKIMLNKIHTSIKQINFEKTDFDDAHKKIRKYCSNQIGLLRSLIQREFSLYIADVLYSLKVNRDIFIVKDYTAFNKSEENPITLYRAEKIWYGKTAYDTSNIPVALQNGLLLKTTSHQTSSHTHQISFPRDLKNSK
jgi:hypothetical protein